MYVFVCVFVCVEHMCICMCVHARTPVSATVCMPPRFNYSSFPVQIWFGFSMSLLFSPSFVYYLLCLGSQCLGRTESQVAIMSLRGCHNYVLIKTHRKRCWPCVAVFQCCQVRHICLPCVLALIARICRLHYFLLPINNRHDSEILYLSLVWNISSDMFPQSSLVTINFCIHSCFFLRFCMQRIIHNKILTERAFLSH